MLSILGIGHAYPETQLETAWIAALGDGQAAAETEARTGIKTRSSSLSKEYISTTKNANPKEAKAQALCTPTDLAFAASEMALARAGVTWAQIGLIIGDGSTPHQTTPSEGQRVGNRAGVKVPAYDSAGLSAAFVLHLNTIFSWSADRVPDYVLCLSSNTPSKLVDYAKGEERFYFGDAAAAVVLSKKHLGPWLVADSFFGAVSGGLTSVRFEMDGHILGGDMRKEAERCAKNGVELSKRALGQNPPNKFVVVDGQLGNELSGAIAERAGIPRTNFISNYATRGYSLGSSPMTVLSEQWGKTAKDSSILVLGSGTGSGAGYAMIKC